MFNHHRHTALWARTAQRAVVSTYLCCVSLHVDPRDGAAGGVGSLGPGLVPGEGGGGGAGDGLVLQILQS